MTTADPIVITVLIVGVSGPHLSCGDPPVTLGKPISLSHLRMNSSDHTIGRTG